MRKILLLLAVQLLVLSGCASGPTIVANTMAGTDFGAYKTYGFFQPLGTDRSNGVRTPLSSRLMASMEREMKARGLTSSDTPDLLIDFNVSAEDRIQVRTTPNMSPTIHRSHWSRRYSVWPTYSTTVRQYTEGSLIIDLVDNNAAALVAEGAATSRISSTDFTQQQIDDVVSQIMGDVWEN